MNWLIFLGITIVLEFIVYLIAVRKDIGNLLLYSVLINAFTNPLANLLQIYLYEPFFSIFYIELLVFIFEIFLIKYLFSVKYWKAVLISLIANFVSFATGIYLGFLG